MFGTLPLGEPIPAEPISSTFQLPGPIGPQLQNHRPANLVDDEGNAAAATSAGGGVTITKTTGGVIIGAGPTSVEI